MPQEIVGGVHADKRGVLRFCNEFDMGAVKRFYTISNSAECPVRGWIGHKKETKWFFPLKGKTTIVLEPMDNSRAERAVPVDEGNLINHVDHVETGSSSTCSACSTRLKTYTLSSDAPSVLKVPPGNWFCIKQDGNAEVMVFSDCKVGEFKDDDFRKPLEDGSL